MGEMRSVYEILNLKRHSSRPRYRWMDIKMGLKRIRYEGVDWIQLAWDEIQW
jgi:hypothetical protein